MEIIIKQVNEINYEFWVALGALIISLVSIIISAIILKIQRKHNLKSVLPIAFIEVGDYENLIFVKIANYGIGPLIIKNLIVSDGKIKKSNLIDFLDIEMPIGFVWSDFTKNIIGRAIKVGDELTLIKICEPDLPLTNENYNNWHKLKYEIREILKNIEIQVNYSSIYEKYEITEFRKLDWFGREITLNKNPKKKIV